MPTPFTLRTQLQRNLTAAEVDANFTGLANGAFHFYIPTAANQDYTVVLVAPHGGNITQTSTQSISGTCTATFKVNGVALGGAVNAVSSTLQTQVQALTNSFVAGDKIVVTISANSSALGVAMSLRFIRTQD